MKNREIARDKWSEFFAELGRRRSNAPATVRVLHPNLGAQVEARELPIAGIAFDEKAGGSIELLLGGRPGTNLEHDIRSPRRVSVESSDQGDEVALEIESEDGTRTLLEFAPRV